MSTFSILLGHSDVLVLQDLARHTEKLLNQLPNAKFELHEIFSSLAHALSYPSWEILQEFNEKDVLFSDVYRVVRQYFPLSIRSLLNSKANKDVGFEAAENVSKKILQRFFPCSDEWLKLWRNDIRGQTSTIKLCLLPVSTPNHFEVIGFKNELDLLIRLEHRQELGIVFGPVVEVNKNAISRRERPYKPARPIFKFIEHYANGAIFVEQDDFLVCHFDFIDSNALRLSHDEISSILVRASYFCPVSYEFSLSLSGNELYLNFHEEENIHVIAKKQLTKLELENIKVHTDGSVALVEHLFMLQALFNELEVDLSNPYEHFCKIQIARSEGFSIIS